MIAINCTVTAENPNPRANEAAQVKWGKARITVLTPQLLRLEWSNTGKWEDKASQVFINRNLPVPQFTVSKEGDWQILSTSALELRYKKNSGKFTAENLLVTLTTLKPPVTWKPGQKDSLNLLGTTRTLDETEGAGTVKLEAGLLSRSGYALIDDSQTPLFDGGNPEWIIDRVSSEQDWYFFGYGHDYRQALSDFTKVAGKIPLPPRFAFGYWWSRYWTYSDSELRELVSEFKSHNLPLDVLVIDMDWHETRGLSLNDPKFDSAGERVGWTGYSWNKDLFPEPKSFLDWAHQNKLKVALNLHPASGINPDEDNYPAFRAAFNPKLKDDKNIPFQIEDRKWTQAWFDNILHPLEQEGVDFWWLDWQAWQENKQIKGLSNTWWLNHVFFTDQQKRGEKRPLLFHRWGGLGNHRYQIGFSGDTYTSWKSLAYQPMFTATAGNVGYGYWSHDIGGHMGNPPTPELYLRWLQYGAYSPILRTHATKNHELERRIWKYPELYPAMRNTLLSRYALTPYLYSQARKAYDTGLSLCRPLYWAYPEAEEAYCSSQEYLLGDDMLIAPVTQPADDDGLVKQAVWLPEGYWYDTVAGALLEGNRTVEKEYTLEEIPVFVKAGAIIPKLPNGESLQEPLTRIELDIYPGQGGTTTLYDDDGSTDGYQEGEFTKTDIRVNETSTQMTVNISPIQGGYPDMPVKRSYTLNLLRRLPPGSVIVNGIDYPYAKEPKPGYWSYKGQDLAVVIQLPEWSCTDSITCSISFAENSEQESLTANVRGILHRLPSLLELVKNEVNRVDPLANPPELLLNYGSLAVRITYNPDKVATELQDFHRNYPALLECIATYPGGDVPLLHKVVRQLSFRRFVANTPVIQLSTVEAGSFATVTMTSSSPEENIYFTLDGSEPDDKAILYTGAFRLCKTALIRSRAYQRGFLPSFCTEAVFHKIWAGTVEYQYPCAPQYNGGSALALADGSFGNPLDFKNNWVGFEQNDAVITCEFINPLKVKEIAVHFLSNQAVWIFFPLNVKFELSTDGVHYKTILDQDTSHEALLPDGKAKLLPVSIPIDDTTRYRYLRITARSTGQCPPWHRGAGGKSWVFVDEITIDGE